MPKNQYPVMQFDFRSCWSDVLNVIRIPEVQELLDDGLADYNAQYPTGAPWRDRSKPWTYATGGYWHEYADREADHGGYLCDLWLDLGFASPEALDEALEAEQDLKIQPVTDRWGNLISDITDRFLPRPDTPEWFQAFGCCHWLAGWQALIGQILVPDMDWRPLYGTHHSTAGGFLPGSRSRTPCIVLDLLREHEDPAETVRDTRRRKPREPRWAFEKPGPVTWTQVSVIAEPLAA